MTRLGIKMVGGLGLSLAACGTSLPPPELDQARDTYARAAKTEAAQLAPVDLDNARQALEAAELAYKDKEGEDVVRDLSYIAARKADIAVSAGNQAQAKRQVEQVAQAKNTLQRDLLESTQQRLGQTQAALEEERRKAEAERLRVQRDKERLEEAAKKGAAEVERVKKQLEEEKKAREAAEKKAAAALASLQKIASVKEEKRGVVITLSGSVLFETGKSDLLPIAMERLREVATALKDQGFRKIVVEGHTDSRGSPAKNEALSLQRAQGVRSYLVSQGIPSDKIEAVGHGPRRPIADNATPEGRANNRRVELVVTPE